MFADLCSEAVRVRPVGVCGQPRGRFDRRPGAGRLFTIESVLEESVKVCQMLLRPRHFLVTTQWRHGGDDTDAGSSKAQSSSGGQKTDFPEMATNEDAFDGLKNVLGSAEYERAHKPYAPLPKGESIPSMQKLWAHAMRRYGRYQGYAWAGVIGTGALAFGLATATKIEGKENAGGAEKKGG